MKSVHDLRHCLKILDSGGCFLKKIPRNFRMGFFQNFRMGNFLADLISNYKFISYFDYFAFTGVDIFSLQAKSLLYIHGFIMTNPQFKAILNSK